MTVAVVDTSVVAIANGEHDNAGVACTIACVETLQQLQAGGLVVIDSLGMILEEYRRHAAFGQLGVGDRFFVWLMDNRGNPARCEQVSITPTDDGSFKEFPTTAELETFDRDDRKFVCVAIASANEPVLNVGIDSDYWEARAPIEAEGVSLGFLCPDAYVSHDR